MLKINLLPVKSMTITFDTVVQQQLASLSLDPVSRTENLRHLDADFAELVALFSGGDFFTAADLVRRFSSSEERDVADDLEIGSRVPERSDETESWAVDVFSLIGERSNVFDEDYPFLVEPKALCIRKEITAKQRLYLMLLMAGNLNYFPKVLAALTTDFERVSFEALKWFLPAHAIVKRFGKDSDYKGNAQEKLSGLARDLGVEINERESRKILGNEDRGLDVVGWIPFSDSYANFLSVFGQCACGKDWFSKQHETRRFENSYLVFQTLPPIHALFVPTSLSRNTDLYQSDEVISGTLLFERRRILEYVRETDFFEGLRSNQFVNGCLVFVEDTV